MLSIHKEILKKEYTQSPLGKVERELTSIYDYMKLNNQALPENVAKEVYDIRDAQEKEMVAYVDMTLKRDREYGDNLLLKNMSKELEILKNHFNKKS